MFRLANAQGRAVLETPDGLHDLAALSGDASLASPMAAISRHRELHSLYELARSRPVDLSISEITLGPPVPDPRQVFGIGLNYKDHANETKAELPPTPLTFTKFPSAIAGPSDPIALSGDHVDWEVELVVVMGDVASHVRPERALEYVAGFTLGQDISDRVVQRTGTPPQFSLGKSFAGYGPTGPALVSLDSFSDVNAIELGCSINEQVMQSSSTEQLIFDASTLVAYLSSIVTLWPGDLIFTGTPSGVGAARGVFLQEGDVIRSWASGIGELRNECIAGREPLAL